MTHGAIERTPPRKWPRVLLACVFAALYGTGFTGSKYATQYAGPFTFFTIRFALVSVVLTAAAVVLRRRWPSSPRALAHQAIAGALLLACSSAGVALAMGLGISPPVAALVISLQPLMAGLASPTQPREKIRPPQYIGLVLGFIGVSSVLSQWVVWARISWVAAAWSVLGLFSVTAGNLYQRRFCNGGDLISGSAIQTAAAAVLCGCAAFAKESWRVAWTPEFMVALAWMGGVVSLGAIILLYALLQRNDSNRVASVYYLAPVSAAVASFYIQGIVPDLTEIAGAGAVVIGVALISYPARGSGAVPGPKTRRMSSAQIREMIDTDQSGALMAATKAGAPAKRRLHQRASAQIAIVRFQGRDGEQMEIELDRDAVSDVMPLVEAFWRRGH